jgi:hypothetical protein
MNLILKISSVLVLLLSVKTAEAKLAYDQTDDLNDGGINGVRDVDFALNRSAC